MREPLLNSMTDLVNGIVLAIMPFLTDGIPFVIFGHSLGGWITYALTQELQLRALPLPCLIMVSGIRAPQLTGVIHDPDGVEMHKLGASDFWEAMERRYGRNPDLVCSILFGVLCICYQNIVSTEIDMLATKEVSK